MKTFQVTVRYDDPYPKTKEYREIAGKIEVAIARGLRKFRATEMKGRPIKSLDVRATLLGKAVELANIKF